VPKNPRILLFEADPNRADQLGDRLREQGFDLSRHQLDDKLPKASSTSANLAILLLDAAHESAAAQTATRLLTQLVEERIMTVISGGDPQLRSACGPLAEWLEPDVSLDEIAAKVGSLARYAPLMKSLERELNHFQRLGHQLNHYFNDIDQEMRLAGRLQRDFLPRKLPSLDGYSFQVIYRPASWVSGDMYDAFRIDEHHLGMFVADAMGHGAAAGLLTMFLRQALVAKRITRGNHTIVPPADALHELNTVLVRQKLPNCQFVTALYGVMDTRTGQLRLARAGHPYPIFVTPDGTPDEVRVEGSLLGLVDVPPVFDETSLQLAPGEKVVFYSDGVEDAVLVPRDSSDVAEFTEVFLQWAKLPASRMVRAVESHLDCREGSLHPADDVTVLILESNKPRRSP
jgi:serine phosphatase RsbU (regulator of sigma subunit)